MLLSLKTAKYTFVLVVLLCLSCKKAPSQQPQARFANYDSLKTYITQQQALFKTSYQKAGAKQKDSILKAACDTVFTAIINDYFGFWYGTPWAFHGMTRIPGKGEIACGYFLTTVLEDAGFKIPRIGWAKAASETMIKGMTKNLKHIINKPVADVETYLKTAGKGLYVVGLDNHTGFIYNDGEKIRFVHSNYYFPDKGVMAQELDSHNPLKNSKYRVIGKILDDEMMKCWILGKKMGS